MILLEPFRPTSEHVVAIKTDRRVSGLEARKMATKEVLKNELAKDEPDYRRCFLTLLEML